MGRKQNKSSEAKRYATFIPTIPRTKLTIQTQLKKPILKFRRQNGFAAAPKEQQLSLAFRTWTKYRIGGERTICTDDKAFT